MLKRKTYMSIRLFCISIARQRNETVAHPQRFRLCVFRENIRVLRGRFYHKGRKESTRTHRGIAATENCLN